MNRTSPLLALALVGVAASGCTAPPLNNDGRQLYSVEQQHPIVVEPQVVHPRDAFPRAEDDVHEVVAPVNLAEPVGRRQARLVAEGLERREDTRAVVGLHEDVDVLRLPRHVRVVREREGTAHQERDALAWHIEADVYNASNVHMGNVQFSTTTTITSNFSASGSAAIGTPQRTIFDLSKNGYTTKYAAVFNANTTIQAYPGASTDIMEKKWSNKNYVFYNSGSGQILIPLGYFPNTISTTISFSRVSNVSTETSKITNVPIVQFGNHKYYTLNNVNSLIRGVDPGIFNYTIQYNPSGFFQESGSFDLTNIGNLHNLNTTSNTVVVLVVWINYTAKLYSRTSITT